jgi:hypothetical protein
MDPMNRLHGRLLALALVLIAVVWGGGSASPHPIQGSAGVCPGACTVGICQEPGTVVQAPRWATNWATVWRQEGSVWCLYYIDVAYRVVRKRLCAGGYVDLIQMVAYRERLCYCVPASLIIPGAGGGTCMNPPPSPGAPPGPPPPVATGNWNCFAAVTGQGPGAPAPAPGPVPSPPGGGTATPTTGSDGFWLETAKSVTSNPCWEAFPCESPEPAGTVVVLFRAATDSQGQPQTAGASAEHAATANGDGTYTSKNGTAPVKNNASADEAFGEYSQPTNGTTTYRVCYRRKPDCQD